VAKVFDRKAYNGVVNNTQQFPAFQKPSALVALCNRAFGFLVGLGLAPGYMQLLQVRGRKSGRMYSSPVNLLHINTRPYLVARAAVRNGCETLT
jgi:hypothetical protein